MKIEITYNNGEQYIALVADGSYDNVITCLMDDVSVSVLHNRGKADKEENSPIITKASPASLGIYKKEGER